MSEENRVWSNGVLMPGNEVALSPFDLGVANGLGVFETLIAYQGITPTFDQHYARLKTSASVMELPVPVVSELSDAIEAVIMANDLSDQRARVRITLGAGRQTLQGDGDVQDYLIVTAVHQPEPLPMAELVLVPMRCNEHSAITGVKSTSYANHLLAFRYAQKANADEAVMLNTSGQICECSMSNLFVVRDEKVLTPPLSSGCLPGVTRGRVIEICQGIGIPVEEVTMSEDVLFTSDEIFITSSGREVQSAKMVDTSLPCPGGITSRIASAYRNAIQIKA